MHIQLQDIEHGHVTLDIPNELVRELLERTLNQPRLRFHPDLAHDLLMSYRRKMLEQGKKTLPAKPANVGVA